MDADEHETPQKFKNRQFPVNCQSSIMTPNENIKVTPKNAKCLRKSLDPRTPKSISYSLATCHTMMSNSGNNSVHSLSMATIQTPPAKRYQRIKNPFENALTERLHLPIIASPSLFQRPDTPQMSSTQCEWTIDEVSSMMPANVELDLAQFHESPDPEMEAKAQLAISSYFKDNQIVPSPVECPLRNHRIVLQDISGNTPLSKPGRRIRDCQTQTELTLPPILPAALEEALKPYFQPHLAGANVELKKSRYTTGSSTSSMSIDAKDTSLRRKLFDIHNVLIWENDPQQPRKSKTSSPGTTGRSSGHSNSSPHSLQSLQHTAIAGKLSDSLDKSSFGSLSPISASDDISPGQGSATKRKSRFDHLRSELEDLEQLSPIHPPVRRKPLDKQLSQSKDITGIDITAPTTSQEAENEKFTPDRSSSPLTSFIHNNIAELSSDSFNIRVSRLKVNSSKCSTTKERVVKPTITNNSLQDVDIFMCQDETTEDLMECTGDIEDMQVSTHSSSCSSSQSDTPRGKRRSASRKNLSQSFSANWLNDDEDYEQKPKDFKEDNHLKKKQDVNLVCSSATSSSFGGVVHHNTPINSSPKKSLTFYRTDSGFNEMSQNSSVSQDCPQLSQEVDKQIQICISSTPSRNKYGFDM